MFRRFFQLLTGKRAMVPSEYFVDDQAIHMPTEEQIERIWSFFQENHIFFAQSRSMLIGFLVQQFANQDLEGEKHET